MVPRRFSPLTSDLSLGGSFRQPLDVFERLAEAGLAEEVIQAGGKFTAQALVFGHEALGDVF